MERHVLNRLTPHRCCGILKLFLLLSSNIDLGSPRPAIHSLSTTHRKGFMPSYVQVCILLTILSSFQIKVMFLFLFSHVCHLGWSSFLYTKLYLYLRYIILLRFSSTIYILLTFVGNLQIHKEKRGFQSLEIRKKNSKLNIPLNRSV